MISLRGALLQAVQILRVVCIPVFLSRSPLVLLLSVLILLLYFFFYFFNLHQDCSVLWLVGLCVGVWESLYMVSS